MDNMYSIIENLCKDRGITVTEMCRELKINRSSLSELKQGRAKSLSTDKVIKIAKFFNVSAEYITSGDDAIRVEAHNDPVYIDDETREIIDSLRSRPEMKVLFSVSKNATKADIEMAVDIIKKFKGDGE